MAEENVKFYTLKEIEAHDTEESAWIVIENSVYDVTKFLEEHPGGAEILLEWAGGEDAKDAFEDAGHSNDAREQLKTYKIGEISMADRVALEKMHQHFENMRTMRSWFLTSAAVFVAGMLIFIVIQKTRN